MRDRTRQILTVVCATFTYLPFQGKGKAAEAKPTGKLVCQCLFKLLLINAKLKVQGKGKQKATSRSGSVKPVDSPGRDDEPAGEEEGGRAERKARPKPKPRHKPRAPPAEDEDNTGEEKGERGESGPRPKAMPNQRINMPASGDDFDIDVHKARYVPNFLPFWGANAGSVGEARGPAKVIAGSAKSKPSAGDSAGDGKDLDDGGNGDDRGSNDGGDADHPLPPRDLVRAFDQTMRRLPTPLMPPP